MHIVSILNVTRYAVQVNRQHINIIMDKVDGTVHDVNNLYNLTISLSTSRKLLPTNTSHQICPSQPSGFPVLYKNSFHAYYGLHVNAATTGTLSPHILPD